MQKKIFLYCQLFFVIGNVIAQENTSVGILSESRIFQKSSIKVIQSSYLDNNGDPSHEVFQKVFGVYPYNEKIGSVPYFTISVPKDAVTNTNGSIQLKNWDKLYNLDFYLEKNTTYTSSNRAIPIWDGRVYEENNRIVVGAYSAKLNEKPVGFFDENEKFVSSGQWDSSNFPLLQIPFDKIHFDPFKKTLFRLDPCSNSVQTRKERLFLPLDLNAKNGGPLNNVQFEIEHQGANSLLILYAYINDKKLEIARCNIQNSEIISAREAFRPNLISGASQQGEGEMLSLTFKGSYSNEISLDGSDIFVDMKNNTLQTSQKSNEVTIDGNFQDWRNIKGIGDVKEDYISYLFENPDTDLLEFKVTNDNKYIYFYTRVSGAHGRTGSKGRYYWYTYIDVDSNPLTGYPPTRDDNCYFGIPIGDDSEAQFEFIGNKFVKTFFGFTGVGAEKEVLSGNLKLGPSYYSRTDKNGNKRDRYKMEYVHRNGSRYTTEDYTEGTSDDIIIALSPDGSEVEVRAEMKGFLKDVEGNSLMQIGKIIDIAVGVEGSSDHYNSGNWGADSSAVIYGYKIK